MNELQIIATLLHSAAVYCWMTSETTYKKLFELQYSIGDQKYHQVKKLLLNAINSCTHLLEDKKTEYLSELEAVLLKLEAGPESEDQHKELFFELRKQFLSVMLQVRNCENKIKKSAQIHKRKGYWQ